MAGCFGTSAEDTFKEFQLDQYLDGYYADYDIVGCDDGDYEEYLEEMGHWGEIEKRRLDEKGSI